MMLCKLSVKNIKKSFKDYAIYFTTLILGVCIFYIFNSMDSQTAMLNVTSQKDELIKILIEVLSYVSVFVSFILAFLIIYASRFLMKKRNKEFGIYMTLGMSKRKISMLLLIETFLIGVISLAIGLVIGVAVSQVTSIFIANMFEADMTRFRFNFSYSAMIKTIIYFGLIYFVVMIFNTIVVNRNKLINLLQSSKKQEKIRLKNPIISFILFIISIAMLGSAYYMVTKGLEELMKHKVEILLVPMGLGAVGTVIFFYSVSGILIKLLSRCRGMYFKNLNTFVFKQISSKINTMVASISVICIMLFITLCLLSSALTIKNYFNKSIEKYTPADFEVVAYYDEVYQDINLKEIIENDNQIKNNVKDVTVITDYYDESFTYGVSLGEYESEIRNKYPHAEYDDRVYIMGETDYNNLAKVFKFETINLDKDKYAIVSNYEPDIYKEVVKRNSIIKIFENDLKPYDKVIDGFTMLTGIPSNIGFFVVDDSIINYENKNSQSLIGNYSTNDKGTIEEIEKKLLGYTADYETYVTTKLEIKDSAVGLSVIVTFIGLYLGIIFLISSSAILALKELSDCIDDKNKYKVLRQIGSDEKDINKALFKQTLIFFMTPLILAIVHTLFGLEFCRLILKSIGIESVLDGSITTFLFLILIYGIYFVITYVCGRNIIKEK